MKNKLALIAFAIGAVAFVSGCDRRHENAPPPAPQAQAPAPPMVAGAVPYYYYPDVEVYYQPESRVYWWFGGGVWVSGPQPPSTIVLRDNARVMVNLNVSEPWRQHETVLRQHPRDKQR